MQTMYKFSISNHFYTQSWNCVHLPILFATLFMHNKKGYSLSSFQTWGISLSLSGLTALRFYKKRFLMRVNYEAGF